MLCQGKNQEGIKWWGKTTRNSDFDDAGTGTFEYIAGEEKYINLIGIKCNFAVRYYNEVSFYKHKCNDRK